MVSEIRFDAETTYGKQQLADALGVSTKTITRWAKGRRTAQIPRPFYIGREPFWRGATLIQWLERKQAEAEAA